jgi:hypothetical protein
LPEVDDFVLVSCPTLSSRSEWRKFKQQLKPMLARLVQWGVTEVAATSNLSELADVRQLYKHSNNRFILHRNLAQTVANDRFDESAPRVPAITLHLPEETEAISIETINLNRPLHLLFAWEDTPDHERPNSTLFDRAANQIRFRDLSARINQ